MSEQVKPLKPCPFCGSADIHPAPTMGYPIQAECRNCGAEGPTKFVASLADDAWNKWPEVSENTSTKALLAVYVDKDLLEARHEYLKVEHAHLQARNAELNKRLEELTVRHTALCDAIRSKL